MTSWLGARESRVLWAGTLLVFLVAWGALLALYWTYPGLPDTDSCYHLAVGRAFARDGVIHELPWARFSVFREGFGDKELLFHVLLVPFGVLDDAGVAGRLALAFWGALLVAALAYLGARAVGPWGLLLPVLLVLTSVGFDNRLNRLRPELLSLFILLLALRAAGKGRYRTLGLLSMAYALSYTAFHAFAGLFGLLFLWRGWVRRRWDWPLLVYPAVGAGLGLVVHPHFPHNLTVWVVQNLTNYTTFLPVPLSPENLPETTRSVLLLNLGWWLALLVLVWSRSRKHSNGPDDETADGLWLASAVFGLLFVFSGRFALYFVPFLSLALLFEGKRRGLGLGRWTSLPYRGRVPTALALLVCVVVSLPALFRWSGRNVDPTRSGWWREEAWQELSRHVPDGAAVAATWSSAQAYVLWAPQGRYLNVLNPIFMSVPFPMEYGVERALFDGQEADVPLAVFTALESRYIAYFAGGEDPRFTARLENDPRIRKLYQGLDVLVEIVPDANDSFVLDWKARRDGEEEWNEYPRADSPEGRRVEGYVNARRVLPDEEAACVRFRRGWNQETPERWSVELAPYGPTVVFLNENPVLSAGGSLGAVLGRGAVVARDLGAGEHVLEILTCPSHGFSGGCGFYLRDLSRGH